MELVVLSPLKTSDKDNGNVEDNSQSSLTDSSTASNLYEIRKKFDGSRKSGNNKPCTGEISDHTENVKQIRRDNLTKSTKYKHGMINNRNLFEENQKFFLGTVSQAKEIDTKLDSASPIYEENKSTFYFLPQSESFHMEVSEKDSFIANDRKFVNTYKKTGGEQKCLEQGLYENQCRKIRRRDINLLEQRFLTTDEKKWFGLYGNLEFSENPLTQISVRPNKNETLEVNCNSPGIKERCKEVIIIKENILEFYIEELKFTHHPLFSVEHVLVEKLCNLYEEYTNYFKNNNIDRIRAQLEASRYLRKNIDDGKEINECTLKRAAKIDRDVQKLRKIYFEEGKKERDNLKDILNTWKQIKRIREKQKFSSTNIKLLIKKETVDYEVDSLRYNREFSETLREITNEIKTDLQEKGRDLENEEELESNHENKNFDTKENIKKNLQKVFRQSFREPGEPVLKLLLSKTNEISKELGDNKEVTRRDVIKLTKIYLNVICDKVPVCKSKPLDLDDNFLLDVKETFSIQLREVPKHLTVEVIEQRKGLAKKKICEIIVRIPLRNFSITNNRLIKTTFENDETVHYKHAGVGCGVDLKNIFEDANLTLPDGNYKLTTTGFVKYNIGWRKTSIMKNDILDGQINVLKNVTNKNLAMNIDKLSDWMDQSILDPQDPRNIVLFEYMAGCNGNLLQNNNFRLSPYIEHFKFCDIIEIEKNIRFKTLCLRDQNETEFDGAVIPNRLKEISFNSKIDSIKTHKHEEDRYRNNGNEIEAQRNAGRKCLKLIYRKLFQLSKNSENNLIYESVVDEKYLAHFEALLKTVLMNFFNWFYWQPNRPLLVTAKTPHKNEPLDRNISKRYKVVVKIVSGKNVPSRNKLTFDKLETAFTENEVEPFVEISYENISVRTNNSSGVNPVWNETLILPLEYQSLDYLNPGSLNGSIVVNLYDECDLKLKQKCHSWLGAVEIPLSAVCYSTTMSGLFKVRSAQLLLGYETETEKSVSKSPKTNSLQSCLHHTYIQMELSIVPNVPKLTTNMESLPCGDLPYIRQHIVNWNRRYNDNFPNRKFSALAVDTNAKTTCITRYLKPLEPPHINLEEFDVNADQCLRYVSLIPFTECNYFYHNVWLTTNELLRFMVGSTTDHAVALACYLLALKMEAWLLLGYGVPRGSTAYVLTREYINDAETPVYNIYDVCYNEKYNLTDPYCPLQKIFCLVSGENIWANTQKTDNIQLTRFDLNRRCDWSPLFNNNITAPTHFINNKVNYDSKIATEYLENQIEIQIKKKITKLRQLNRTIWDHNLTDDFKSMLRSFEINYMYNKNHYETVNEFYDKLSSCTVIGYVINSAYSNASTIIKNLKKLGICEQENSNEFALAVYIHVYPGPLLSVWIFIANIIKKSDINVL